MDSELRSRVRRLDMRAQEALEGLTPKQKRFVLAYVGGDNLMEAGRQAGYADGSAYPIAKRPNVATAIILMQKLDQLRHGVAVSKKREILLDVAAKAAEPGDTYGPGSAVSAVRTLCELDGDIKSGSTVAPGVVINISTGIQRDEKVIEQDE